MTVTSRLNEGHVMVESAAAAVDDVDADAPSTPEAKATPTADDLKDIQGLVYSGWGDHKHAGYLFATIHDGETSQLAARRWLADIARDVLLMVFARKPDELTTLVDTHSAAMRTFATVRAPELTQHLDGKEHFGFA